MMKVSTPLRSKLTPKAWWSLSKLALMKELISEAESDGAGVADRRSNARINFMPREANRYADFLARMEEINQE